MKKTSALLLALACSVLVGAAQLLLKAGAERLRHSGFTVKPFSPNGWNDWQAWLWFLLAGLLLGAGLAALLAALRGGELSTLYAVLAARYVWVVGVTPFLFPTESLNVLKLAGAGLAAAGVALVAGASTRREGPALKATPES